ncbi:hypothetical protein IC582_018031 [Cucumis melo]
MFPFDSWHCVSRQEVPKSATFTLISSFRSKLFDLRSLWITPWEWRYSIPLDMSRANLSIVSVESEYGSFLFRYILRVPCDIYSVIMQYTGGFLQAAMNCTPNSHEFNILKNLYLSVHISERESLWFCCKE